MTSENYRKFKFVSISKVLSEHGHTDGLMLCVDPSELQWQRCVVETDPIAFKA